MLFVQVVYQVEILLYGLLMQYCQEANLDLNW